MFVSQSCVRNAWGRLLGLSEEYFEPKDRKCPDSDIQIRSSVHHRHWMSKIYSWHLNPRAKAGCSSAPFWAEGYGPFPYPIPSLFRFHSIVRNNIRSSFKRAGRGIRYKRTAFVFVTYFLAPWHTFHMYIVYYPISNSSLHRNRTRGLLVIVFG